MDRRHMLLKCYAEKRGNLWVAVCLNFNLATQADSFEEAKRFLLAQIEDHIAEALAAPEPIRHQLLYKRKAPIIDYARYMVLGWLAKVSEYCRDSARIFSEDRPALA